MQNQHTPRTWGLSSIMRDFGQAWRLVRDPQVPTVMKLLLPVAAVLYFLWPLDLMPGLPFDDIAILIVALRVFVQLTEQMQNRAGGTNYENQQRHNSTAEQTIETSWRVVDE